MERTRILPLLFKHELTDKSLTSRYQLACKPQQNSLNRILLFAFCLFCPGAVIAQTSYQQITLGGGLGGATAYAGANSPKTDLAFYVDAAYYPIPLFNIGLQGQSGMLGGARAPNSINPKSFKNTYQAAMLTGQLYLGVFYQEGASSFLNALRNFYGGAGYGVIANNIYNTDISAAKITNHVTNTLHMVPVTGGYEFNILKNKFNEPLLKANFSSAFYYIIGKGLDGYYDNNSKSFDFYTFYAIGLKYTIILHANHGRSYNKFD